MSRGTPLTDDVKRRFMNAFLACGSVSIAARRVGIPIRTGNDLARHLEKTPKFAKRRRELYARALDRAEFAVMGAIDVCARRMHTAPEKLAGPNGSVMSVHDKGPEYARAVADLARTVQAQRKYDFDRRMKLLEVKRNIDGAALPARLEIAFSAASADDATTEAVHVPEINDACGSGGADADGTAGDADPVGIHAPSDLGT